MLKMLNLLCDRIRRVLWGQKWEIKQTRNDKVVKTKRKLGAVLINVGDLAAEKLLQCPS